ncbi:glycosyltransferase family A protein [Thermosynechococcaceae cyanobacterium BACA0444]|uniref:Glycosyltransferase family A protein n=1 Tax=Pseudocalidococcus azoricus BACA0444 TaxID=2918990 RepID=A0AAE4FUE3_9CYAN|nr:glycosyltransferase family A protein [Pseudocalidococcus azoricus]MDS3861156.1 glycosyltransferase family A protein [Pseudocalidococcus azoricus BACA0444]
MIDDKPLVSIIIPVHNGELFLGEALASIHRQYYEPIEVIVVDDDSTDQTADIAKSDPLVHYLKSSCAGPGPARNRGLEIAKGEFVTFLDSDDFWLDNILGKFVEYLQIRPLVDIVQGLMQPYVLNSELGVFLPDSQPVFLMQLGCCLYRKSLFQKVGTFDESLYSGQDMDWFIRAWELGIIKHRLAQVVLYYRRHDKNITKSIKILQKGRLEAFHRHLQRMKQKNSQIMDNNHSSLMDYLGAWPERLNIF